MTQKRVAPSTEQISNFDSTIEIQTDGSLNISEQIEYFTPVAKHGIYRYLPMQTQTETYTFPTQVKLNQLTINGQPSKQFSTSTENGFKFYKIGDPDQTFSGERTYGLNYQMQNAVQLHNDRAELYWDINGTGWDFPISQVTATIYAPENVEILEAICYSGSYGSADNNCSASTSANKSTIIANNLGPNETLTVAIALPKEAVTLPTWWQQRGINFYSFLLLIGVIAPGLIMLAWWYKKGRDQVSRAPHFALDKVTTYQTKTKGLFERLLVPFVYEPFKDYSPAQVIAITKENIPTQIIAAEIVDLARQKILKITVEIKKRRLRTDKTVYSFEKIGSDNQIAKLADHQQFFVQKMFANAKNNVVTLEQLSGKFYTHFENFKKQVFKSLQEQKLSSKNLQNQRILGMVAGGIGTVISFGLAITLSEQLSLLTPWPMLISGLLAPVALLCGWNLPQKTAAGSSIAQQAKGLKRTIARGAWREKIKEKHLFIEEVLPFAIAFGVVSQLAKDWQALGEQPPSYLPAQAALWTNANAFDREFTKAISQGMAVNPNSSQGSSGSGFSGGFSGGGGGGGGGGSW